LALLRYIVLTVVFAVLVTAAVEFIVRGTAQEVYLFFHNDPRAAATTIGCITLFLWILDGIIGRSFAGGGLLASTLIVMAIACRLKMNFLDAPLYPTDFVFVRQIADLFPLLAANKLVLVCVVIGIPIALFLTVGIAIIRYRRGLRLPVAMRAAMVLVSVGALVLVGANLNYRSYSKLRAELGLNPKVWDQNANYESNGLLAAFAMNVPMAIVTEPAHYTKANVLKVSSPQTVTVPQQKPDIIMVMVESLWDVTRLPKTEIEPDPIPTLRKVSSGYSFSPEFGGLTANVEFEALTGFSNAFLPDGSIPYQQFVRHDLPSLASFFNGLGYETRALHPYKAWFWNRGVVYEDFGFQQFRSQERLPPLKKKGKEVGDDVFTTEIIKEADAEQKPFFYFAVTIQNHGPYKADRYKNYTVDVSSPLGPDVEGPVQTYAEGARDADKMLERLIDWAEKRSRPTILVMFGDHLPPLAGVYDDTKFLHDPSATGKELAEALKRERETPLVIWSNRSGALRDLGPISPAFIPLHLLRTAGMTHPYYTGFLGQVFEQFPVVDRRVLYGSDGSASVDWLRQKPIPPLLRQFWLVEYDQIFGRRYSTEELFPEDAPEHHLSASASEAMSDEAPVVPASMAVRN
jgi:phosphoglycerol transferase MdoB-like AlkP superfamily enzyme